MKSDNRDIIIDKLNVAIDKLPSDISLQQAREVGDQLCAILDVYFRKDDGIPVISRSFFNNNSRGSLLNLKHYSGSSATHHLFKLPFSPTSYMWTIKKDLPVPVETELPSDHMLSSILNHLAVKNYYYDADEWRKAVSRSFKKTKYVIFDDETLNPTNTTTSIVRCLFGPKFYAEYPLIRRVMNVFSKMNAKLFIYETTDQDFLVIGNNLIGFYIEG